MTERVKAIADGAELAQLRMERGRLILKRNQLSDLGDYNDEAYEEFLHATEPGIGFGSGWLTERVEEIDKRLSELDGATCPGLTDRDLALLLNVTVEQVKKLHHRAITAEVAKRVSNHVRWELDNSVGWCKRRLEQE